MTRATETGLAPLPKVTLRQPVPGHPALWVDDLNADPHELEIELRPVFNPISPGVLGFLWLGIFVGMGVPVATVLAAYAPSLGPLPHIAALLASGVGLGATMSRVHTAMQLELNSHRLRITRWTLLGNANPWEVPLASVDRVDVVDNAIRITTRDQTRTVVLPDRSEATRQALAQLIRDHRDRTERGDPSEIPDALQGVLDRS